MAKIFLKGLFALFCIFFLLIFIYYLNVLILEQAKEKEKATKNPFTFKADKDETLDQADDKEANSLEQSIEIKSESKSSR